MNVSIVGASGYSGAELIKILLKHRHVTIKSVYAHNSAGKRVDELYGMFRGQTDLVFERYSVGQAADSDLVFIALPSGEAMHVVPELLKAKKRIIDLGGDYRLKDINAYQKYYQREHVSAETLPLSTYGLPEWNCEEIKNARLVANPGCYATGAILPLIPIVKENLVEETEIIISSLSGVSGAGRSASLDYSFSEVNESVRAYKVGVHQHTPEIEAAITENASHAVNVTFVPHLIPITRGIYSSIYLRLKKNVEHEEIFSLYKKYYSAAPFVRVSSTAIPEIKNVNDTNFCDIGFRIDERNNTLVLLSVIDNLVKGAAGQAVQNMNIMLGFKETEGLV
ncbi:MAG: N-acetyl-gamma-glutamyl-phosphate reductase [Bacteroidota bacterium]